MEFKHRNVSAVLLKLGLPYIDGYKPAKNYQRSLVDAVRAHLEANPALFAALDQATEFTPDALPKLEDWQRIFEAPPDDTPMPDALAEPWRSRQGRKIDFVRRESANHRLGRLGEEFAVELERRRLLGFGRDDLAKKVEWAVGGRPHQVTIIEIAATGDEDVHWDAHLLIQIYRVKIVQSATNSFHL